MSRSLLRRIAGGAPAVLLAAAATLYVLPLAWMVLTSFKGPEEIFGWTASPWPAQWRWANYAEVWHRSRLFPMMVNSVAVAGAVVAGQVVTSAIAGYSLARLPGRSGRILMAVFVASLLVPDQLTWIPSFWLLEKAGLIDTRGALIVPFLAGAMAVLIMRQQFLSVPRELEEAAMLDGCGPWALLRHVLLPAVTPGLRAVAVITFLFSWGDLLWPLLMTHRAEVRTLPVGLAFLQDELSGQWHLLLAGSVIAAVPALWAVGALTARFAHVDENTSTQGQEATS